MYLLLKSLDMSGRSQSGQPKSGSRQEGAPPDVDMEEAPPSMSDGDVCMPATSQSPHLVSAAVSSGFLAFRIYLIFHKPLYLYHCHFSFPKRLAEFVLIPATFLILIIFFLLHGCI